MKTSTITALGILAIFLSGLMIGACTGTQINTELPANHPANPTAETAVFVPPPNPFARNTFDSEPVQPPDSTGQHPKHGDHPKHQKEGDPGHGIQPMQPPSAAPGDSTKKSTEHQH